MHKKIALLAALALPSLALANPYIIAGGATAKADMADVEDLYGPITATSDQNFGRALIGVGADLNPNLGVEALYMTEGEATVRGGGAKDSLTNSGVQFALIGKAPLTSQLNVFGKLSANYMTVQWDYTNAGFTSSTEDSKFQLGYGIGVHYQFTDAVGAQVAVERIQLRDAATDPNSGTKVDTDLDQASVGFTFSF